MGSDSALRIFRSLVDLDLSHNKITKVLVGRKTGPTIDDIVLGNIISRIIHDYVDFSLDSDHL